MSEYKQVKIGKLKLKGSSSNKKSKKFKRKRTHEESSDQSKTFVEEDNDSKFHGGWWKIDSFEKLNSGNVAIETFSNSYIFAVDNGTLRLGSQHDVSDDGPVQEEILMMIQISENKVAFKTGYGKYISVNAKGDVLARSDAVGPQEQLEVVIQDKKVALQGHNGYFITFTEEGEVKSLSKTAKDKEIVVLRTNAARSKKKKDSEEDTKDVRECEISYVKQFQSYGDHKMHLHLHEGPKSSLVKARISGKLHEAMLDRREKMKADRYCK